MNSFLDKTQKFSFFVIFVLFIGFNSTMEACVSLPAPQRRDFFGNPDGTLSHYWNMAELDRQKRAELEKHQWDRLIDVEKGYLRKLFSEGLEPKEIEIIESEQSRFKLGLFGRYPAAKKSVIDKIKEFYQLTDDGYNFKWAANLDNVEAFFSAQNGALCCGEKKALDLAVCELYAELVKGTKPAALTGGCKALYDFLSNPLPGTNDHFHVRNIFGAVLKHLDHCSEESRKDGNPKDFPRLVESIRLFFENTNPGTKGYISRSGLTLSDFDRGHEFRPIFESLCRHDHSPVFKKTFATETWFSTLSNGRNLGPIIFGLGILASAGFGVKRWLEIKSSEYKELSRKSKKEKIKKFNRTVIGILTGSALIGFLLFQFLDDQLAVKFLKVKPKL